MTTTTFDADISAELADRELFLESTRSKRILKAQAVLKSAHPTTVERPVRVLEEYRDLHGCRRYWQVWRTRTFLLTVQ